MSKSFKHYKGVTVSQGTNLYAALEAGDEKLALKLYKEADTEYRKYNPKYVPTVEDIPKLEAEVAMLQCRVDAGISVRYERQHLALAQEHLDSLQLLKES